MTIDDLVPKVLEAARRGRLVWRACEDDTFTAPVGSRLISVSRCAEVEHEFRILDGQEELVDALVVDRRHPRNRELSELFLEARRSALGTGAIIAELHEELCGLGNDR